MPFGSAEQPDRKIDDPYLLGLRIEHLLAVTNTQRSNHIARLAYRNDARAQDAHALIFDKDDMKEIMNEWRHQPQTWMDSKSLAKVNEIENRQAYHQACKKRFSTMLFQLFGNKALAEIFVRFPVCSAEQPASIIKNFAKAWHNFRDSEEANRAREHSKKKEEPRDPRLSKQIYALKQRQLRGQWIADWIDEDERNWFQLSHQDQELWHEHQRKDFDRQISELQKKQQRFTGAAESFYTFISSDL